MLRLTKSENESFALHAETYIEAVDGCELTLRKGQKDRGVIELAEMKFECLLTQGGWLDVAGLIQPFCQGEFSGYQWLKRTGKIALLLSHSGKW